MLEQLKRYAQTMRWLRPICLTAFAVFGLMFIDAIAGWVIGDDRLMIPGLLGMTWSLLLYIAIVSFPNVPAPAAATDSGWQRTKIRIRRFGYILLALGVVIIALATLRMTLSLWGVWSRDF
jgi:hypothetical protein